ncbi:MAG: hypothetical protein AAGG51_25340 [Cyanobacteria bacterium P01_G01_bin.54]
MTLQNKYWLAGLLGSSGIALSSLVPGGPIEIRDFSHINPLTLGVFNTFLTTLCLGSLLLIYFVLKSERWAIFMASVCGLSYLGVYGLDLAVIFPVSPDAMPPALLAIEIFGTILAFPLILLPIQMLPNLTAATVATAPSLHSEQPTACQLPQMAIATSVGIIALGIIIFATYSAMGL